MAEPKVETLVPTPEPEVEVEKTSRLKAFTVNHPRTAKVVGIVAITGATLGAIQLWKSRQEDDETETQDDENVVPFENSSKTA